MNGGTLTSWSARTPAIALWREAGRVRGPTVAVKRASLMAQIVKNLAASAEDQGSTPGLGRSPGEGNGNPLQYSCLENPMDRGTWRATVHGVTKSQIQLGG